MSVTRTLLALCFAVCAACGPVDADPSEPDAIVCPSAEMTGPEGDVNGLMPLQFSRSGEEALADFELELTLGGDPVAVTETSSGVYEPDYPLTPNSEYAWRYGNEDCEDGAGSFSTSSLGGVVIAQNALVGQTFGIPVDPTSFPFMLFVDENPSLRLRVDAINGPEAWVTVARSTPPTTDDEDESGQDACETTTQHLGIWDNPYLILGGESLMFPIGVVDVGGARAGVDGGAEVELRDWKMELLFHPQGDAVYTRHVDALVDTRDLGEFEYATLGTGLEGDGSVGNFCINFAMAFGGVSCERCPDGLETCLSAQASGWEPGIVEVDLVDIADDERENHLCEASCDNALDDDGDGDLDTDVECDPGEWPI